MKVIDVVTSRLLLKFLQINYILPKNIKFPENLGLQASNNHNYIVSVIETTNTHRRPKSDNSQQYREKSSQDFR